MPQVILAQQKGNQVDGSDKAKVFNFLTKLHHDDTTPGLHIEPMVGAVDPRARTGRVDQSLRAVLFRLDPPGGESTYVFTGVFPHDEAIEYARTRQLRVNPVNGVNEIIEAQGADVDTHAEGVVEKAREIAAVREKQAAAIAEGLTVTPLLERKGYSFDELVTVAGFSEHDAAALMAARDDAELTELVDAFQNAWQELAVIAMLDGKPLQGLMDELAAEPEVDEATTVDSGVSGDEDGADKPEKPIAEHEGQPAAPLETPESDPDSEEDARILAGFSHPVARRQFHYVGDQDELRRVIEAEDFGAWTVFLHPDQQRYVDRGYNGPFRLTGGAGTGKTVVLLHRARRLVRDRIDAGEPAPRVVLTTFTRSLARMLQRDLLRLDPRLPIASKLGDPGIYVGGVDQLVAEVRRRWNDEFDRASIDVLGSSSQSRTPEPDNGAAWESAIEPYRTELGERLANAAFFDEEYIDLVLREGVTNRDDYLATSRVGMGTRLGRKQRMAVWKVIEQYRLGHKLDQQISFAELAAVAARALDEVPGRLADHVLVDEGQDLSSPQWLFLRALAEPGRNDLFISEDVHQRIYGRPVRMIRVGINLRGRSRRLKLNYRTTQETLDFALRALVGETWKTDAPEALAETSGDGEAWDTEGISGYLSARRGPKPRLEAASRRIDQADTVVDLVRDWIDAGVAHSSIAVLCRRRRDAQQLAVVLGEQDIDARFVMASSEEDDSSVVTMTMHQAKGHEFRCVVLYDMSKGSFPSSPRRGASEEEIEASRMHEAALLYVAATRARDELAVTYTGEPTALLG